MNTLSRLLFLLFGLLRETLSGLASSVNCDDITKPGSQHLSSTSRHALAGDLILPIPAHTKEGDLLVLFMSRTDDILPLELDGWTTGPSCFKQDNKGNHLRECWKAEDCLEPATSQSGFKYCARFPQNHTGKDLATIVFTKEVESHNETNAIFHWILPGYLPAWATLVAIAGANNSHPIRSSAHTSCDKKAAAVFPSVYGTNGDILLLSMAHDDAAHPNNFQAPYGTQQLQDQHGSDEAGFLYARRLNFTGKTPTYATRGAGTQWWCKDALLSLVVRMLPRAQQQQEAVPVSRSSTTNATTNETVMISNSTVAEEEEDNGNDELLILGADYASCIDQEYTTTMLVAEAVHGLVQAFYSLVKFKWNLFS